MRSPLLSYARAVLILVPFLAAGCDDGGAPAEPDPVISPAAAATPTPPPATGPNANIGCNAGPGTFNDNCVRQSPTFLGDVNAAIDRVIARRPELFNLNDARGNGGYLVLQGDEYHREVMTELRQAGFCAVKDANEIGVKLNNDFNDQFHIMLSSGHVRRGEASYRTTCNPAWF